MRAAAFSGPAGTSTAVLGGANLLGLLISLATGSHLHLDLIGTGAIGVAAMATKGGVPGSLQGISASCVTLWAVKLTSFLVYRALQIKRDARLETTLSTAKGASGFWLISFLWGALVSLPHTLAAAVPVAARPELGLISKIGVGVFGLGFGIETLADYQKWQFKKLNGARFCGDGVWGLCQHPNWFGNLLLWTGVLIMNAPTLLAEVPGENGAARWLRFGGALLSPLFLLTLFSAQATNKMGGAVTLANERYGADARYVEWRDTTPLLFPNFRTTLLTLKRLFGF
jgi:steroid 5-alpha reductase family enzyme